MLIYFISFLFILGVMKFILSHNHLLMMLLSLEFMVVILYMNIYFYLNIMSYEYMFLMIFLTLSVCEGALGLSILVMMVRVYGNDYLLSLSNLW
uniref:NADH-ubiquinone oxidoreductase chain 4L n=1 Tax=Acrocrypta assamensis TaxID=715818 RepID=A0A411DA21_9CUCU|nr:NADH dehydrogenase subunit 4L [Acrocrypta assamensis]